MKSGQQVEKNSQMSRLKDWFCFSSGRKKTLRIVLSAALLLASHLSYGLADLSGLESSDAALQSCPAIEDEIIDLQLLAKGLKKSKAVGMLEKLKLKSAIEDLVDRFDAYHQGVRRFSMAELQQQYDVLLVRIAAHLQHKDILLHQQLCNAWFLIWEDLSDPLRFQEKFS